MGIIPTIYLTFFRFFLLSNSDWLTLKKQIKHHELRIVSLDIPTSSQALSEKEPSENDSITRAVISAIKNMLIDLMATISHKNWIVVDKGIESAHQQTNKLNIKVSRQIF